MGWRNWNAWLTDVNQSRMEAAMHSVAKARQGGASLLSLGYSDVGLDDYWQACGTGVNGSYHTAEGKPLVNLTRFPDMKGMVDTGHQLGLKVGWYANNCGCAEKGFSAADIDKQMVGDVHATVFEYGFDSLKLDGCGQKLNNSRWVELFNQTGKGVMLENCHWGGDLRAGKVCDYHIARTSPDITVGPGLVPPAHAHAPAPAPCMHLQ